ncbi:7 transmembrane sweet-taste receptor of 3 GCPR-domain-containing protein [Polychytrium aggregatum]|uniref:7 transmembrane sweet-taste receptor of 3 GCPR-domain-containing protein n=1 Tax=Polychytrium aggregatum TaxID=110093 RepID=UPI0022FE031B|nr:7 transmembrane sweet-taste receptor of 3 GCPR-domain-containing protein [Polychytrium aggregatum]KAI9204252.1 7 transmembrane sweet-taste receptor of 3 GCPR-domain-containing protein [Polychytrium aggregatum]
MNNMQLDCSEPSAPFMILFYGVESYNTAIMAFLSITGLINAAILAMLFVFREKPNIKAISPNCCYIIVVGALFGQIGALFYSAEPSTLVCSSRMFFPVIAFSSIFSMLLMKSVRIYMIFENRRMRVFKTPDWKLILATLVVLVAEIVVCAAWVAVEGPTAEVEGSFYGLVCTATFSPTVVPEIVLYAINGAIMLGCVAFAYLTRGAHERFQESKVIGICSYMVSLTLVLCLPIVYILSGSLDSQALFTVGRVILACLIITISSFVPAALFAGRIIGALRSDPGEDEKSGAPKPMHTSDNSSIQSQGMLSADIVTYVYDCGVQGLKFGGAWVSSTVLVFVTLDIIEFRDPSLDGPIQASFRFSACGCELCDPESDPEGGKALARSVKLRNSKSQLTLEFGSKETALTFLNNFKEAKAKPRNSKVKESGPSESGDVSASGTNDRIIASRFDESIDSQRS